MASLAKTFLLCPSLHNVHKSWDRSAPWCFASHYSPELFQGTIMFTKLDLRNAYHLVKIRVGDEW